MAHKGQMLATQSDTMTSRSGILGSSNVIAIILSALGCPLNHRLGLKAVTAGHF